MNIVNFMTDKREIIPQGYFAAVETFCCEPCAPAIVHLILLWLLLSGLRMKNGKLNALFMGGGLRYRRSEKQSPLHSLYPTKLQLVSIFSRIVAFFTWGC